MKTIEIKKCGKEWYVRVFNADGSLQTQASFCTKKAAIACREHWIEAKTFGEAMAR